MSFISDWNINAAGNAGAAGLPGAGYQATSTTSLTIASGSQTFTTAAGLAYSPGARVRASSAGTAGAFMEGIVTAYSGTVLTVNVDTIGGSGAHADWNINLSGQAGAAGLLRSYLAGIGLAVVSSTTYSVAPGGAADSNNSIAISNAAALTKSLSAWAAGNNNGSLGVGLTLAAATWYHVYAAIVSGSFDVFLDTANPPTHQPAGTTAYRRIGSIRTNASSQITSFKQNGDEFLWTPPFLDANGLATGALAPLGLTVPTGVQVNAILMAQYATSSGNTCAIFPPDAGSLSAGWGAGGAGGQMWATSGYNADAQINVRTNTSGQVNVISGLAGTLSLMTYGWIDRRGRDA
jgi:hypothetical protein